MRPRPRGANPSSHSGDLVPWALPPYNHRTMNPAEARHHLLGTTLERFTAFCAERELAPYRARQVFEWVYEKGVTDFAAMTNLSKPLRKMLAEHWVIETATEAGRRESTDGTIKLLLQWPDGAGSECVLIPEGQRQTACISSQVGCPVGCTFCASGLGGLQRQLTIGQIVEQAMRIRDLAQSPRSAASPALPPASGTAEPFTRDRAEGRGRSLTNIVFMGLGEPLANYDAVVGAIRIINADWGMNLGARRMTVSTVGLPDQIRRLAREDLQVNLAISLHAPTDRLRQELIPWAQKVSIDELAAAAREFFETTGREVTIEYLLLGGVNDKTDHANRLVTICRKMRCNVNLIRYNPVPGLDFERPTSFAAHWFVEQLRSRGVNVHVRRSKGLDIGAACGQLRRADSLKPQTKEVETIKEQG